MIRGKFSPTKLTTDFQKITNFIKKPLNKRYQSMYNCFNVIARLPKATRRLIEDAEKGKLGMSRFVLSFVEVVL